jgi:hypothetical protein
MNNSTPTFGPGCPWYDMYEKWGPANVKWCEERLCSWINEPANAWSNLSYILFGLYIFRSAQRDRIPLGKVFGIFVMVMGIASFVYHSSNNYFTQVVDFVGMYVYVYLILVLNCFKLGWLPQRRVVPLFLFLVALSTLMIPVSKYLNIPYQIIVLASAVGITFTEAVHQIRSSRRLEPWSYRYFWAGLAMFSIALAFSLSDVKRILCDPNNHFIQGHALWHIMGGIGTYFSYLYYRQFLPIEAASENRQNN